VPDRRARVRAIFAATLLLFVAQVGFTTAFEEPWPALAMPAFRWTGGAGGEVTGQVHDLVFGFADGSEREVAWRRLWPPQLKLGDGLAILCKPELHTRPDGVPFDWLPGYRLGLARRDAPESRAALREWLRARARVLLAAGEPSAFECRAFRERVRVRDGELQRDRRARSTRRVELGP
jgi:hypothetical protein